MKDQQINSMEKIYRSAALTIVIAVDERGCGKLPGFDHRPRERAKRQPSALIRARDSLTYAKLRHSF
jgi:hypothetical protein